MLSQWVTTLFCNEKFGPVSCTHITLHVVPRKYLTHHSICSTEEISHTSLYMQYQGNISHITLHLVPRKYLTHHSTCSTEEISRQDFQEQFVSEFLEILKKCFLVTGSIQWFLNIITVWTISQQSLVLLQLQLSVTLYFTHLSGFLEFLKQLALILRNKIDIHIYKID